MEKLRVQEHIYLTENILKSLSQNRITTLLDFLQEDAEKLSTISKLKLPQILDIRKSIFDKYSAPLANGTSLFINGITCKQFIPTGFDSLDTILNKGIPVGFITEICGLAGCGKSQICMQLAINCVKSTNNTVLYIDTKGDFSAVRIQEMLQANGMSHKDMAFIMLKIKIAHVWCMEDLIKLFEDIKSGVIVIEDLMQIIIDSLPCLMFQHFGDDNKIGLKLLNIFVNHARFICKKLEIAIVCTNIQTRWIDQDTVYPEEDDQSTSSTVRETTYTEKLNRCLGKYWHTIPAIILFLEKYQNSNKKYCSKVKVAVTKYNNSEKYINCLLEISSSGVR